MMTNFKTHSKTLLWWFYRNVRFRQFVPRKSLVFFFVLFSVENFEFVTRIQMYKLFILCYFSFHSDLNSLGIIMSFVETFSLALSLSLAFSLSLLLLQLLLIHSKLYFFLLLSVYSHGWWNCAQVYNCQMPLVKMNSRPLFMHK